MVKGLPLLNFLFWNLGNQSSGDRVARLARNRQIDILIVAECKILPADMLRALNVDDGIPFVHPYNLPGPLEFFVRGTESKLVVVTDTRRISIRRFIPAIGTDFLIAAAHLPSKLYSSDEDQNFACVELAKQIADAEKHVGHSRTIVVGDFNMNPFQPGIVAANGMHAVMDRRVAERGERTIQKKSYPFLYNPMWSMMGDKGGRPPGSYYYAKSGHVTYFWHIFDQVLIRPEMIPRFDHDSLCIITSDGVESLMDENGRPDPVAASDHFPIAFSVTDQR